MKVRRVQLFCSIIFSVVAALATLGPRLTSGAGSENKEGFNKILDLRERLAARAVKTYQLETKDPERLYSISVSLPSPGLLGAQDQILVTLRDQQKDIARKVLHAGDPDLYSLFRPARGGACQLEVASSAAVSVEHTVTLLEWPAAKSAKVAVEAEPNDSWREANEIKLGQIVWATADDKPYILPLGEKAIVQAAKSGGATKDNTQALAARSQAVIGYEQTAAASEKLGGDVLPEGGVDWFKFTYDGNEPKLVYFELDLLERDNIPVDVSVYTVEDGEAKSYGKGIDPVSPPHEVQALPGNKFTTRVITRGTYYVRVDANHPFYQLRTSAYDLPPYHDPRQAVRTAMDYIISAGDSWHANTPRHGGIVNRVANVHAETTTCIACHATHFTTRAELIARQNGYPIVERAPLQFLTERLYNNPRPFYGHPEASWARVISASANVMSRLAVLLNLYENEISGERRLSLLKGVGGYLKIYYRGRSELPKDESNGNTPLVSTYEVAWYSWKVFDELFKQTGEDEYRSYRELVRSLLEQDKHKNLVDLCYQTIAFVTIDRAAYADKLKRNAERILSYQRADGQWSMLFEPDSPAVEFQTYHCLYTLALAGYSPDHPQVAKSLKLLLARQQDFGGWFDPKQSYENFRTPFRETQFAVMALSEFYKGNATGRGWQVGFAPLPERLAEDDPFVELEHMDQVWDKPGQPVINDLVTNLASEEPVLRASAAAALGRIAAQEALAPLSRALGDRSKMVQLVAAQAIRQIVTRRQVGYDVIQSALGDQSERVRWGATRVFAQHFAYLAGNTEAAERLIGLLGDPSVMVRMQAAKALMQWFYWTKDGALQDRIADAFVARMAVNEHPWVRRNLLEGLYSLADENVRYLYDNWIALLAQKEDREKAIQGHHEASRRMAERIARALEAGNELQREGLLRGLTEFHLRSGGYTNAGRYTRIGNDVETIKFYPEGAPALERALLPLLNAPQAERRQQAILAAYTLRDNMLLELPLLVMQRLTDPDPKVRGVADEFYRSLPLKVVGQNRQAAVKVLKELLASSFPEAQIAALDRIKTLGQDFARREQFDTEVKNFVLRASDKDGGRVAPAALRSLADFPYLANDARVQQRIASSLQSPDESLLRAGVQLVLMKPELRDLPPIAAALDTLLKTGGAAKRKLILNLINTDMPVEGDLRVIGLLVEALEDRDENVRSAALNTVRRVKPLQSNAAIRAGLAHLTKDPNQRLQGLAVAIYQGQDGGVALDLSGSADKLLDYAFFVERVMPLLARKGPDGNACVNCHATHTIFRLTPPGASGRFTEEQLRDNYRSALKVVDLANPENSLILRKPISDSLQEGVVGAKKTAHGGGMRWQGTSDPAWQTVLEWINGAKVSAVRRSGR